MKEATITINVKSLTGGYEVPDKENTNTTNTTGSSSSTTVKEKKLTVKVGEDKVYDKKVDLNSTNIQTKISGKGTVTQQVHIHLNKVQIGDGAKNARLQFAKYRSSHINLT